MWTGFGTAGVPFSAHRYREIERSLSHPTLAQRAAAARRVAGAGAPFVDRSVAVRVGAIAALGHGPDLVGATTVAPVAPLAVEDHAHLRTCSAGPDAEGADRPRSTALRLPGRTGTAIVDPPVAIIVDSVSALVDAGGGACVRTGVARATEVRCGGTPERESRGETEHEE